jgi:hypothetical protein
MATSNVFVSTVKLLTSVEAFTPENSIVNPTEKSPVTVTLSILDKFSSADSTSAATAL